MSGIGRRSVLKGAIFGGLGAVVLARAAVGQDMRPMDDLEGRPVQRIKDPSAMTDLEKQHLITIDVPAEVNELEPFKLSFAVPNHPMERNHHVYWARTYLDNQGVSFLTFAPMWQRPEATLVYTFWKGNRIDVIVECNEHGLWAASAPLKIKQANGIQSTGVEST